MTKLSSARVDGGFEIELAWLCATICGVLLAVMIAIAASPSWAFAEYAAARPVRVEGYVDPVAGSPEVLDEITISADGRERRTFGITALQAYKPEEEGPQVFRTSRLRPVTLLLRGERPIVEQLLTAETSERIVAYGVYRGSSGTFVLMSVEGATTASR